MAIAPSAVLPANRASGTRMVRDRGLMPAI
jgi:hypothetical protein